MKKLVSFTAYVTIEVDTENETVKEYGDMDEVVSDVISYRFNPVLPIISDGAVTVEDINYDCVEVHEPQH